MGLVDYSDSEGSGSEAEAPPKPTPKSSSTSSKKPFQKVVDRSNPGKIIVNLPSLASDAAKPNGDEPPTKRVRTGGGGRFAGFNSFLPPPKNANKPKPTSSGSASRPVPAVSLKTSAAPGFSRDVDGSEDGALEGSSGGLNLPPPKAPSIPEGQKPEGEVKLVGKPLMFKPLSVSRGKKKTPKTFPVAKASLGATKPEAEKSTNGSEAGSASAAPAPAPAPKISLFSMYTEEASEPTKSTGAYEPLFATESSLGDYGGDAYDDYAQYASTAQSGPSATTAPGTDSLDTIADDLNLSAAARRELFGRDGSGNQGAKRVVNFNMDKEYQHNEQLRAAGEQQTHNPVRAIQGGKHSLRQLVQNVQNQREALEDSFAKGKSNRREASSRYGW